jgi:hypothetical protein
VAVIEECQVFDTFNHIALAVNQATYHSDTGASISGYTVGWFTLAVINGGLAQGKNRSGMNWFLLSLLLGPLATCVLVGFYPKL